MTVKKVSGSALYIVIVIALVIGVICAALVAIAAFYRLQDQQAHRFERLQHNLHSGIEQLLANTGTTLTDVKSIDLYNDGQDSIYLQKYTWGLYDVGIVKACKLQDTLTGVFTIARNIDSTKWTALYLADEDRPLGVTGKTLIKGDAYLPAAGVKSTYVDGRQYEGPKNIISGKTTRSKPLLPELDEFRIKLLREQLSSIKGNVSQSQLTGTFSNQFQHVEQIISASKNILTLSSGSLSGRITIHSDTTVVIDSTMTLDNVLIFAKAIDVKSGFHGRCQLFATDSIRIGKRCQFNYPSAAGVIRTKRYKTQVPVQLRLEVATEFNGILFTYEKEPDVLKPVIELGEHTNITGQLHTSGYIRLSEKGNTIKGSIFCSRFLYRTAFSTFENYLINATISSDGLSPYYMTTSLLPIAANRQQILQWLERK
ncbi:hypothetical protein LJ707_10420 [Mucilaginibacter sp. UR6-1]|uniref:hypothetical protein n=1 Tax=Mucilaginibacter sp. UR6-1 TaxID=1435643 RepID=UPI001E633627|nr:hypothetical protein [Mucilaginibacter sp. UR6-1]MCC8409347.1 hypothetical protein [Mucilaginibacter sp. UR6-1]